jgi:hypothetical protein
VQEQFNGNNRWSIFRRAVVVAACVTANTLIQILAVLVCMAADLREIRRSLQK